MSVLFEADLIAKIKHFIDQHNLFTVGQRIIIGLSGGPDSVCLLHVLSKLKVDYGLDLIAAHLDHQWRINSQEDIFFCKELCQKLDIEFVWAQAKDLELQNKTTGSLEELGRILRRQFFEKIASEFNADHIALAHHQNDQIETFLIRLIRGATISGLGSIRACNGLYIRPLLEITKTEIYDYLKENNLEYLTDPTNQELSQLRNRIRHIVIPALEQTDNRFMQNFIRDIEHIQNADDFIQRQSTIALYNCLIKQENKDWLDLSKFLEIDIFLQKTVLVNWLCLSKVKFELTEKFIEEIYRYLNFGQSKSHKLGPNWKIIKNKHLAAITKSE